MGPKIKDEKQFNALMISFHLSVFFLNFFLILNSDLLTQICTSTCLTLKCRRLPNQSALDIWSLFCALTRGESTAQSADKSASNQFLCALRRSKRVSRPVDIWVSVPGKLGYVMVTQFMSGDAGSD